MCYLEAWGGNSAWRWTFYALVLCKITWHSVYMAIVFSFNLVTWPSWNIVFGKYLSIFSKYPKCTGFLNYFVCRDNSLKWAIMEVVSLTGRFFYLFRFMIFYLLVNSDVPLSSEILSFISCLWRHHSLFAFTEHACIYYRLNYLSRWLPIQTDPWNTKLIATFLPRQPIYVLLKFLYSWLLHSFTNFNILKDIYSENMTE